MTQHKFLFFVSLFAIVLGCHPELQAQVWTNPETAKQERRDFSLQGEYRGKLQQQGETTPVGAQVIARGNDSFRLVIYPGGLPGQGWNGKKRFTLQSQTQNNQVFFKAGTDLPFAKALLKNGRMKLMNKNGQVNGRLKKGERTSPTLGKKPPEDAVILFDGTKETLQKHWQNGANMTDDGLLTEGATSKDKFQDARIHLEFRLPFKPHATGQSRGNSGFYIQGRYEIQMLDSFGLEEAHNRCGGIYEIRPPDVNMCYPPLSWQTYDVIFHAPEYDGNKKSAPARMTVKHNGVIIHKDVPVKRSTRASPLDEGPNPGPLYLQDHGNPVRYRNIWVVPLDQ